MVFDNGTPHAPNLGYAHGLAGVAGHAGIALFYLECYLHWPALKQHAQQGLERCVALMVKFSDDEKPMPNLCCGFYGDLDLLHLIDQRVNDMAFDGLKETMDKLHGISQETSLDTFFVDLFHGIPSCLYLNLRHQFPESMPSALYW